MKFILQVITIVVLAYILEIFFSWWTIAVAAFIGGFLVKSSANFLAGFMGIALLWGIYAFNIDSNAMVPLGERVAAIFKLNSSILLILTTALIGGLVGGFASLTGSLLKSKRRGYY